MTMNILIVKALRDFLEARVTRDGASVSAYRRPMGYQQIVNPVVATFLTVPANVAGNAPGYVIIQCEGATSAVRWRDDGVAPSSTIGMTLNTGQELDYSGDLTTIQFIGSAGTPTLNISFYA